jgi:hypothetical protein
LRLFRLYHQWLTEVRGDVTPVTQKGYLMRGG